MKWLDAYDVISKQASKRAMTNRDASGLILFGRAAQKLLESHTVSTNVVPSASFNWYGDALLALGWATRGDRFIMTEAWQKQPYVDSGQLMAELNALAGELDAAGVPFKMLRNPAGSADTYKSLALDAYHLMQRIDPLSADAHGPAPATSKQASKPAGHHHPKKPKPPKATDDPAPPIVVQPPSIPVTHPDGVVEHVTPDPIVVQPVVAPPSGGNPAAVPSQGDTMPVEIVPPPIVVPPRQAGNPPIVVQPPVVVAQAPVIPHPDDGADGQPGDWYWRKHSADGGLTPPDPLTLPKKPKKDKPAGGGDSAGILLLLVVLAFS